MRILIVEAGLDSAAELDSRLTALGHDVALATASAGGEAVLLAESLTPELLLVEMAQPHLADAVTSAAAILRRSPAPVVFMGRDGDEALPRQSGLDHPYSYLVPPFSDRELTTCLDLATARYQARQTAHELDGFFAISRDLFCFLDFNGYFRRLNPAWERTLGFTRQELMSRPFIEFVHPDDRERTLAQNAQVRSGGQAADFENRYLCKDGSYRWLLWNAAPRSAEGVIYSVARDVTARKQAEAERAELVRSLEASLAEVKALRDILPICMYCRKIRDDEDYWHTVENYISQHTKTRFSHGICPDCLVTEVGEDLR
ncbi:MAG: PAS domain S-box protein [Gemmatimonadota bacterium]